MKYPDVDVGKVFHLNKMLINKSFRRFWIQTKDFRIRQAKRLLEKEGIIEPVDNEEPQEPPEPDYSKGI